jgi:soluble lytic murein transglycosylase
MTTRLCWAKIIRVLCASGLLAFTASAASLAELSRAYQNSPAARASLAAFAAAHPRGEPGALARLALAYGDLRHNRPAEAATASADAAARLPKLADYAHFLRAQALSALKQHQPSLEAASAVVPMKPRSPVLGQAISHAALAHIELGQPDQAVQTLQTNLPLLSPWASGILYARALRQSGQLGAAALQYQRVYIETPRSPEAAAAEAALAELQAEMGDSYPPLLARHILLRADLLMRGGEARKAIAELTAALPRFTGADRDLARVRIGAARYFANENAAAAAYLSSAETPHPEADAERLHYIVQANRRLSRYEEALAATAGLARAHPHSEWRLTALIALADVFLIRNEPENYEPLYTACFQAFPKDPRAAYCHWKIAWLNYLRNRESSARWFEEHIEKYPESEKTAAALYFLGRIHESKREPQISRALYEAAGRRFPNSYYSVLARERLADPDLRAVRPAAVTERYLRGIRAAAPSPQDFQPDAASLHRIERARLLAAAGLDQWAEEELRFGARNDARPAVMAMELGRLAAERGAPQAGVRSIKQLTPGYLNWSLDQAPPAFWKQAFPMPYRGELEKHANARSLDPHLVAALIRQESEFDARAVSRAKAVGLTQILPSTGREISRKLNLGPFRVSMLSQPSTNLNMGTFYLRSMLDSLDERWEAALAAYNAGKSRAVRWLGWLGDYREPAEFIETVPFRETRDYIQIILRNADIYRRLYAQESRAQVVPSSGGPDDSRAAQSRSGQPDRRAPALP